MRWLSNTGRNAATRDVAWDVQRQILLFWIAASGGHGLRPDPLGSRRVDHGMEQ
jgi:hypothetical protein